METHEHSVLVPLDRIDADGRFNVRGEIDVQDDSFLTLKMSIEERPGLETPITVRPHPRREGQFMVVAGHRRIAAYRALYARATTDVDRAFYGDIPAFVRTYSDQEAYVANLTENSAREDLRPWQIAERLVWMHTEYKISYPTLAKHAGLNPSYAQTLVLLETKLHPQLRTIFRGEHAGLGSVTMNDLITLARHSADHDDQMRRYEALLAARDEARRLAEGGRLHGFHPSDVARPTVAGKRVKYKQAQEALLSLGAVDLVEWRGQTPFEPTERERQLTRELLRWILGLSTRSPLVARVARSKGPHAA